MTKDFNEPGRISLFHNEPGRNNGPTHSGYAIAHRDLKAGEKVAVSLWDKETGALSLSGKLSDYQPKKQNNDF